jgi:KipI family sensor histidine kinase inhibitor
VKAKRALVKPLPFGEAAWLVVLDAAAPASERADLTLSAAEALRAALPEADVVVGAGTLLVASASPTTRPDAAVIEAALARVTHASLRDDASRPLHELPLVYDGPDLGELAARLGTSPDEVARLHAAPTYRVELLGFLPGFAYLAGLDPALRLPRRPSPRPRVAPNSVGIAGEHSGIYPFASPGGWTLLGNYVGASLFDAQRDLPSLLQPGDRVRFKPLRPSDAPPPSAPAKPNLLGPPARGVRVLRAPPGTSIQDGGRPGRLHAGLPPSGPIDAELHAAANLAVGNAPDAAALELPFGAFAMASLGTLRLSVDGEEPRTLRDGETLECAAHARAFRYLAVEGGFDVPPLLGARATLAVARLGGFEGRFVRVGDHLPAGTRAASAPDVTSAAPHVAGPSSHVASPAPSAAGLVPTSLATNTTPPEAPVGVVTIYVDAGPHLERFPREAWGALLASEWTLGRLIDRVGARIEGPRLPREGSDLTVPCPMVRGAMQISRDGQPIVLGPDHPTTGGYPVLAVVRRASLALLGRLRPGHPLRFAPGP